MSLPRIPFFRLFLSRMSFSVTYVPLPHVSPLPARPPPVYPFSLKKGEKLYLSLVKSSRVTSLLNYLGKVLEIVVAE